jgi:nicotinate-nucleotide adenylyltransferase
VLLRNQDTAETLVQTVKRYETEYGAQIRFVPFEKQEISSTLIRRKVKNGERLTGLVPEGVEQYIAEHRLYR